MENYTQQISSCWQQSNKQPNCQGHRETAGRGERIGHNLVLSMVSCHMFVFHRKLEITAHLQEHLWKTRWISDLGYLLANKMCITFLFRIANIMRSFGIFFCPFPVQILSKSDTHTPNIWTQKPLRVGVEWGASRKWRLQAHVMGGGRWQGWQKHIWKLWAVVHCMERMPTPFRVHNHQGGNKGIFFPKSNIKVWQKTISSLLVNKIASEVVKTFTSD